MGPRGRDRLLRPARAAPPERGARTPRASPSARSPPRSGSPPAPPPVNHLAVRAGQCPECLSVTGRTEIGNGKRFHRAREHLGREGGGIGGGLASDLLALGQAYEDLNFLPSQILPCPLERLTTLPGMAARYKRPFTPSGNRTARTICFLFFPPPPRAHSS